MHRKNEHEAKIVGVCYSAPINYFGATIRLSLIIIYLCCLSLSAHAQDDVTIPATSWSITDSCVDEAETPPRDWTFNGTILATGWAGIHGINAQLETPYVATFLHRSYMPITVSPDGHWIAHIEADSRWDQRTWAGRRVTLGRVVVGSTLDARERYESDYHESAFEISAMHLDLYLFKLPWWDNDTLILDVGYDDDISETYLVAWAYQTDEIFQIDVHPRNWELLDNYSYVSPDWTRQLLLNSYDVSVERSFFDLETGDNIPFSASSLGDFNWAEWLPDSSGFVVTTNSMGLGYENWQNSLVLFDRDGGYLDTIASNPNRDTWLRMFGISPNGEYVAFGYTADPEAPGTLHIANLQTREIVNTCITAASVVWSQDSRQLAIMAHSGHQSILIFDMDAWRLYNTGRYHTGKLIFWRAD